MSGNEPLPALGNALALALLAAPFLVLALRRAARRLAPRARPSFRWKSGEAAAIVVLPFLCVAVVSVFLAPRGAAPDDGGAGDSPEEAAAEPVAPPEPDVLSAMLGTQLVLGSAAGLALVLASRRAQGVESLGLRVRPPAAGFTSVLLVYVPGFLVTMGIGLAWAYVCRAFGWEEQQEVLRLIVGLGHGELVVALVVAILVGPFIEELLFRGFLQGFMAQVVGERWALVCASALFARLHGLAGLPSLFLLSLFLGWLQQRTRSLWVPWSAHALNNAVSLALALSIGDKGIP